MGVGVGVGVGAGVWPGPGSGVVADGQHDQRVDVDALMAGGRDVLDADRVPPQLDQLRLKTIWRTCVFDENVFTMPAYLPST